MVKSLFLMAKSWFFSISNSEIQILRIGSDFEPSPNHHFSKFWLAKSNFPPPKKKTVSDRLAQDQAGDRMHHQPRGSDQVAEEDLGRVKRFARKTRNTRNTGEIFQDVSENGLIPRYGI